MTGLEPANFFDPNEAAYQISLHPGICHSQLLSPAAQPSGDGRIRTATKCMQNIDAPINTTAPKTQALTA